MGKRKQNQIPEHLTLFDLELLPIEYQTPEEMIESLRHKDVFRYRVKTVRAGNQIECEIYPIWKTHEAKRAKAINSSRQAQINLNHRNTQKNITRLSNANFTSSDIWETVGYDDDNLPDSLEQAHRDVTNYIKRIDRLRKKYRLERMKYIYVTEFSRDGEKVRCHHHIIMSGGLDRDEVEAKWKGGAYPQTRRLRVKEDCGLDGLASYLSKGKKNERKWGHSKNLKKPIITTADHKFTRRQIEKMIIDENRIPATMEKKCKGYTFRDIKINRSDFVAGVYIYTRMFKRC